MLNSSLLRDTLISHLTDSISDYPKVCFISPDFGAKALDLFRERYPSQFIFPGIAEQLSVDFAYGCSLAGHVPIIYGMAPFVTARCFEQYKVLFGQTSYPLFIFAVGPGLSYDHNTISHYCLEDISLFNSIPTFDIIHPLFCDTGRTYFDNYLKDPSKIYMRVDRQPLPLSLHDLNISSVSCNGSFLFNRDRSTLVVTYGAITFDILDQYTCSVLALENLSSLSQETLSIMLSFEKVILVDESLRYNGIYPLISSALSDHQSLCHLFIDSDIMFKKISQKVARSFYLLSPLGSLLSPV
jgi:transketolase